MKEVKTNNNLIFANLSNKLINGIIIFGESKINKLYLLSWMYRQFPSDFNGKSKSFIDIANYQHLNDSDIHDILFTINNSFIFINNLDNIRVKQIIADLNQKNEFYSDLSLVTTISVDSIEEITNQLNLANTNQKIAFIKTNLDNISNANIIQNISIIDFADYN